MERYTLSADLLKDFAEAIRAQAARPIPRTLLIQRVQDTPAVTVTEIQDGKYIVILINGEILYDK